MDGKTSRKGHGARGTGPARAAAERMGYGTGPKAGGGAGPHRERGTASAQGTDMILRLDRLDPVSGGETDILPDADWCRALSDQLGLSSLRKLRLSVRLRPSGRRDWTLTGRLGATVVQPCVVTLEPVTTRIDQDVHRLYRADEPDPATLTEAETEIPADTDTEPLREEIDLGALIAEELALAIPDFPRKAGARLDDAVFTEPGRAPMTDADAKPFAVLARLRQKGANDGDGDGGE